MFSIYNTNSMKKEKLELSKIVINKDNDRFEPQVSEKKAIEEMINNEKDRLYRLGVDIKEKGLNPMTIPCAIRHNGKFVLKDGNRRMTTIKLIKEDNLRDLITDSNLKRKFEELSNECKDRLPTKFEVAVFEKEEEEEADRWIERIHAGEKGGIGQTKWSPKAKQRFEERRGNNTGLGHQALSILGENFDTTGIQRSTLDRVLGDPDVREFYSIEVKKKRINVDTTSRLDELVNKMRGISVGDVYTKENRENFFDINGKSKDTTTKPDTEAEPRERKAFGIIELKGISPNNLKEKNLLIEAKKLNYTTQKMTCLFTFRALFEITLYDALYEIEETKDKISRHEENKKIPGVKFLVDTFWNSNKANEKFNFTKDETDLLKNECFQPKFLREVNSSLHNSKYIPTEDDVKSLIETYFPILEKIWEKSNK